MNSSCVVWKQLTEKLMLKKVIYLGSSSGTPGRKQREKTKARTNILEKHPLTPVAKTSTDEPTF